MGTHKVVLPILFILLLTFGLVLAVPAFAEETETLKPPTQSGFDPGVAPINGEFTGQSPPEVPGGDPEPVTGQDVPPVGVTEVGDPGWSPWTWAAIALGGVLVIVLIIALGARNNRVDRIR